MATRSKVLDLYRCLLRESSKFPTYNYRMYALRRIKHAFRRNKDINDAEKIIELYNYGAKNLEIIKRQVLVGQLYQSSPLVIESLQHQTSNVT